MLITMFQAGAEHPGLNLAAGGRGRYRIVAEGGKRLRPSLTLVLGALGGDSGPTLPPLGV